MTALTDAERRKLEGQLFEELRKDCAESRSIGYPPRVFESMMGRLGPVEACRRVIVSDTPPDGFLTLLEKKRLDLTAEATVLRGPWRALFDESLLARARKRLTTYERPDLAAG